jgi:hypothetical protein
MRKSLLALCCVIILGVSVFLGAQPQPERIKVRLRLLDASTGQGVSGIVHVTGADGKQVELPGLFDRMAGLTKDMPGIHWYVIPAGGAETMLPAGKLHLRALSGLETSLTEQDIDLRGGAPGEIALKLTFLFHPDQLGLAAGNTHLHLRNFTLEQADEYLRQIPAADGLRVLFISYLERHKEDVTYITNKYPVGDLPKLSVAGVLVNNGEEHRHNFEGFGEGYGHVMFLNIKELVRPVSLGPGITGAGFDDTALRPGIDDARRQGGTVLWCHNTNGFEDVLSAITGRLDALNVFDGSRTGRYEDNYYRYLNLGLRLPISTGTDWFMYDQSRVYAEVRGKLTIPAWLDAVKAGRCQATNGPLLTLAVDGKKPGDVIDLKAPKLVKIQASAVGRHPVQKLQLVQNGKVVKTQATKEPGRVQLTHEVRLDEPAWFALRIDSDAKNEFGKTVFAHSSPVYVNYQGRGMFDVEAGLALLKQVEEGQAAIKARGRFSSAAAQQKLLALYDAAAQDLRDRINARSGR